MGRMGSLIVSFFLVTIIFSAVPFRMDEAEGEFKEFPVRNISEPSVEICDWRWNRSGAVSLTFDDGLNSQAMIAAPLLAQYDQVGTFFITTDNCEIPFGANWTDWQNVSDMGHEIGSHTISHPDLTTLSPENLTKEVVGSREIIEENLTGVDVETFSYPMGRYNDTVLQFVADNYLAARMDSHNISGPPKPESKHPENMYSVVPCNFGSGQTASDLSDLVNTTIDSEGWLVEMIHAVGSGGYDPVSLQDFTVHLDYLYRRWTDLWVDTFLNVSKYIRERENTDVQFTIEDDEYLNITLTSDLGEEFDVPLSLEIDVPDDWIDVDVIGEGQFEHLSSYHRKYGQYRKRSIIVNTGCNSNITIKKNITYPLFRSYAYSPTYGSSDTEFGFGVEYYSRMNRGPVNNITLHFDLNGDGDTQDIVNGMAEGNYSLDLEAVASGIYLTEIHGTWISFPPGIHHPRFFFEAKDTAGLYIREPEIGFHENVFVNNPPPAPENLTIQDYHDLSPTFNWGEVEDPDGDNVTYDLVLEQNGSTVWLVSTENAYITSPELEFDKNYTLFLNATDDFALSSGNVILNFTLENSPPDTPMNLSVTNLHSLNPIFSWDPVTDPDGDTVSYEYQLITLNDISKYYEIEEIDNTSVKIDLSSSPLFHDKWFNIAHTFKVWAHDEYGERSSETGLVFTPENSKPSPITNLRVEETDTTSPVLKLNSSVDIDGDNVTYSISIHLRENNGHYKVLDLGFMFFNETSLQLPDLFEHGKTYFVYVSAHDGLGGSSGTFKTNFTIDLSPDPVQFIFIEDRGAFEGGVYLQWAYGTDLIEGISGFFVYAYSSNPETDPDPTSIQKLDVWKNRETWVGNLTDGQEYWFTIVAYDADGRESQKLTFVNGTPMDLVPPSKATMLRLELVNRPFGCKMYWQIPDPHDLERIMVYRAEGEPPYDASTMLPIHVIDDWRYQGTTYLDTSIEENKTYFYCIVTMDEYGNAITSNLFWTELNTTNEEDISKLDHDIEVPEDGFDFRPCVVPFLLFVILMLIMIVVLLILKKQRGNDGLYYAEE